MAEAMTPEKRTAGSDNRNDVILKIAKICKQQGSYHISAKKYAEAGERMKAMKVLIKTRDTAKIIKFASKNQHQCRNTCKYQSAQLHVCRKQS